MVGDRRWSALAVIGAGMVVATFGWLMRWVDVPGVREHSAMPEIGYFAGWMWLGETLIVAGIGFAMLVGMRRNYTPPPLLPLVAAVLAALGLAFATYGVHVMRGLHIRERRYIGGFEISPDLTDPKLTLTVAPYVTLLGFVLVVIGGTWLWRVAASAKRHGVAELARINRAHAIAQGDLVPAVPVEEPPLPRL